MRPLLSTCFFATLVAAIIASCDPRLEALASHSVGHWLRGSYITMAFASWEAGELPMDPAGFPWADWSRRIGGIPTLGRGISLAMPCVGLDAWTAAMAQMRWPGPYMVILQQMYNTYNKLLSLANTYIIFTTISNNCQSNHKLL